MGIDAVPHLGGARAAAFQGAVDGADRLAEAGTAGCGVVRRRHVPGAGLGVPVPGADFSGRRGVGLRQRGVVQQIQTEGVVGGFVAQSASPDPKVFGLTLAQCVT
ncbi:hypothetical protein GCM10022420_008740 [Streptomyces iranensis]